MTEKSPFITELQEAASLAALRSTAFGTSRRDKVASEQLEQDASAVEGAARVNVNILAGADELHKEILEVQRALRRDFIDMTSVWDVEGWRLLPNAMFSDLAGTIKKAQDEMTALKAQLRVDAPAIIQRALGNLGDFAQRAKMPTPDELSEAYSISYEFIPVPDGSNFAGMSPKITKWLSDKLEANVKAKAAMAMREPMERLNNELLAFVERMEAADKREDSPTKTKVGTFRSSIVTNLEATTKLMAHFNLTKDPVFAGIVQRMQDMLDGVTPDALRADRAAREAARNRANDILGMVGTYKQGG